MEAIKSPLAKLLEEMAALPENRTEAALVAANPKPSLPAKKLSESSVNDEKHGQPMAVKTPIRDCLESQEQLSRLLQQCYLMLKKYGEAADITSIRDAGFQWMLEDYDIDQVTSAFRQYLKKEKEIPTPADIIEILDPSVKPMCGRVYQRLADRSKNGPFALTLEESEYIEKYEAIEISKGRCKGS